MPESLGPDPSGGAEVGSGPSPEAEVTAEAPTPTTESSEPATYKVAVVDLNKSVEAVARDVADEKMTAEKKELKGFKGAISKIWKHNLFQAYYRNQEVAQARQKILSEGNLFAGYGADRGEHDKEIGAIVDRFTSEYDELVHAQAGEQGEVLENDEYGQQVKNEVLALIKDYASERIDDEAFAEEKTRLLGAIQLVRPDLLSSGAFFADNIGEIAKAVKASLHEGVSLDDLDSRVQIVLGEARAGVRTEAKFNAVDRVIARMKESKIGQFVNETTAASAVAIALSVGQTVTRGAASRVLSWVTFGGSALVGAGFAGLRENTRLKEERSQHARERAMGKEIMPDSERREQMEKFQYETRSASTMATGLQELLIGLETVSNDSASVQAAMAELAGIEARNKLSDEQKIDLIKFSSVTAVERERCQLDVARAEIKAYLRNLIKNDPDLALPEGADFDTHLSRLMAAQVTELTGGDRGIAAKDRLFNKMRHKQVAKAAIKGLATGLVVGEVAHEIRGAITGEMTPGQWLLAYFSDRLPRADMSQAHEEVINAAGSTVKLPANIQLEANSNGTFNFIDSHTGNRVVEHVSFNPDGTLTDESKAVLGEMGVRTPEDTKHLSEVIHSEKTVGAKDWVESHKAGATHVHRKLWFDNDTPRKYDLNELKLWWGGKGGVDANGNYVFNVSHMTPNGSFHSGFSTNAQEMVANGKMKMLLSVSRDTQKMVFEVPIDGHGNAIIDKNSEIGKALFETDSKGHAIYKGKFAEVAYSDGVSKDGGENVKILATHVGHGLKTATTTINETISHDVTQTLIDIPVKYDVIPPPVIPIIGRRPLEPLGKRSQEAVRQYGSGSGSERRSLTELRDFYPNQEAVLTEAAHFATIDPLIKDKLAEYTQSGSVESLQQLMNLVIENKKEGELLFGQEFAENSHFARQLSGSEEIVIVLDDPIGDAVLTAPLIDVIEKYLALTGQAKRIVVQSKHADLFQAYTERYPNVVVVDTNQELTLSDKSFILNGRKREFTGSGDQSVPTAEKRTDFATNVIDFEWLSWEPQAYPTTVFSGQAERIGTRVIRTVPGMIARNMEILTGIKMYEGLEKQEFRLPQPANQEQQLTALKEKYSLGEHYVVIAPSSSIRPKEYRPEDWQKIVSGLFESRGWNQEVVIVKPQNQEDANNLATALEKIPKSAQDRIKYVDEPLSNLAVLLGAADLSISPDTGVGHISAALGKETLMLFSAANPTIWQAPGPGMHYLGSDERVRELIKEKKGVHSEAWDKENMLNYLTRSGIGLVNLDPNRVIERARALLSK